MLKQLFDKRKNTLAILLVFFVIISMTVSAVSTQSPVNLTKMSPSHINKASLPKNTTVHIFVHDKDIQTLTRNTNHKGLGSPDITYDSFDLETPYSIACVYRVTDLNVSEPSGYRPLTTNTTPNGGAGAIAIVIPLNDSTAAMDLQKFSNDFQIPQADFEVKYATGNNYPFISSTPPPEASDGGEPALNTQ